MMQEDFEEDEEEDGLPVRCEACDSTNVMIRDSAYICQDCANEGIVEHKRAR